MAKSPADIARKWSRNLASSTESIKQGVNAVTVAPSEKAIRQQDAFLSGVQRSVAEGRWQAGLRRVSLQDWKDAMINKGLTRVAAGASAGTPKMEQFMGEFLPHVEAGQRMLESMPRGDIQTNIARAVSMIEHLAKFRRRQ